MESRRDRVRFILRDYGRSCDPRRIRSRELSDVRPGGVGVHIIRQVFDNVKYEPCRRGTRLVLERDSARTPARRPSFDRDPFSFGQTAGNSLSGYFVSRSRVVSDIPLNFSFL